MTKDRVFQYARELNQMVKQATELAGQIDQLSANMEIANKLKDTDRSAQFIKSRIEAKGVLDGLVAVLQEKTNRADLEQSEKLLHQLSARIESLGQLESQLYQIEAALELNSATGEYDTEGGREMRKDLEKTLDNYRVKVAKQLELAAALIPNKPVVLSVAPSSLILPG